LQESLPGLKFIFLAITNPVLPKIGWHSFLVR
jgi:hypothetical protein